MSVQAMVWVFTHSESTGNTRLVALAIADAANREGANSYQSVETIARMANVSESTTHRAISRLVECGELSGEERLGQTTVYRFPKMGGAKMTPPSGEGVSKKPGGVSSDPQRGVTGDTQPQEPKTPVGRSRATTTPDSLELTPPMLMWWEKNKTPGVDVNKETEQFLDYHRAKGSTFVKWDSAWRTWMRKATPNLVTRSARPESREERMYREGWR